MEEFERKLKSMLKEVYVAAYGHGFTNGRYSKDNMNEKALEKAFERWYDLHMN